MSQERKAVWGWALYDWANSAFATTVMAAFFPVFFKTYWSAGSNVNVSTAQLGLGNSLASLMVALMAPVLGAVADRGSARKKFLIFFAYLGALSTAALFLVGKGDWPAAILVYALGVIGFSGSNVFYDSLLPAVAGEERVDRVSCFGFALGYLGGGLLLAVNVLMTSKPALFGLADAGQAVRYSFLSVALWWGGFTLMTILWVPEARVLSGPEREGGPVRDGFRQLGRTLRKIRSLKTVLLFLVAYWCYIDGVDTIIKMAVDYGMSLGFDSTHLVLALLMVQFIGFPAALVFGRLGQGWGVRRSIFLALGIYMAVSVFGMFITSTREFYLLAAAVGLVQGGIQALSRSFYSRLIPPGQAGEFYGFYNMLGKFAAILGPVLMGLVGLLARLALIPPGAGPEQIQAAGRLASRLSIGSVMILFLVGFFLFKAVDESKGRAEAVRFVQLDS